MLEVQQNRIFAANMLADCYASHRDDAQLADVLIAAYAEAGKGDEYDIATTIVDCIADIGYRAGTEGKDVGRIFEQVAAGDTTGDEAGIILALEAAYRDDKAGFEADKTFTDLVRIARGHIGVELADEDVEELRAAGMK